MNWYLEIMLVLVGIGVVAQLYMLMKFVSFMHRAEAWMQNTPGGGGVGAGAAPK
ncbi:MAG: hypothetical protein HZA54_02595 [Planctomycetes bacterium]|nr:hypothetical protein [Planctomycetota bacterium]